MESLTPIQVVGINATKLPDQWSIRLDIGGASYYVSAAYAQRLAAELLEARRLVLHCQTPGQMFSKQIDT
jgi:hypothetical protein